MQKRKLHRLKQYDYSQAGGYFVTICVFKHQCLFGEIVNGGMRLSVWGKIVESIWNELDKRFANITTNEFIVMPNHVHGIIIIHPSAVGAGFPRPFKNDPAHTHGRSGEETSPLRLPTLGQIVAYFKYQSAKHMNAVRNTPGGMVWQRNYYEHVIRNEKDLNRIREYIQNNPLDWEMDVENIKNICGMNP